MAAISNGLIQLGIEAQKGALMMVQAPVMAIIQFAFPFTMIAMIVMVRQTTPPSVLQPCSFQERSLPNDGSLIQMQSFMCNINQTCRKNDTDISPSEANAQKRFAALQRSLNPFFKNETKKESMTNLRHSFRVMKTATRLLKNTLLTTSLNRDLVIGNYFNNHTKVIWLLAYKYKTLTVERARDLMNGTINFKQIANGSASENVRDVICNATLLRKYVKFSSNMTAYGVSSALCSFDPSRDAALVRELGQEIRFDQVLYLFRDYAKAIGNRDLAADIENIAEFVDFLSYFEFSEYLDEALYRILTKWFGTLIHRATKSFGLDSILKTVNELSTLIQAFQPLISETGASDTPLWISLRNGLTWLRSALSFVKNTPRHDFKITIKFKMVFIDSTQLLKIIKDRFPSSSIVLTKLMDGKMRFEGVSRMIEQWLLGKSIKQIMCESPTLLSIMCVKTAATPNCTDYATVLKAQNLLCASKSTEADKLVKMMEASMMNMTAFESRIRAIVAHGMKPHELVDQLRRLNNVTYLVNLVKSIDGLFNASKRIQPSLRVLVLMLESGTEDVSKYIAGIGYTADMLLNSGILPGNALKVLRSSKLAARSLTLALVKAEEFLKAVTGLLKTDRMIQMQLRFIVSKARDLSFFKDRHVINLILKIAGTNSTSSGFSELCASSPTSPALRSAKSTLCSDLTRTAIQQLKTRIYQRMQPSLRNVTRLTHSFTTNRSSARSWEVVAHRLTNGCSMISDQVEEFIKTATALLGVRIPESTAKSIENIVYQSVLIDSSTALFQQLDSDDSLVHWNETKSIILMYRNVLVFYTEMLEATMTALAEDASMVSAMRKDPNFQNLVKRLIQNVPVMLKLAPELWRRRFDLSGMKSGDGLCTDYSLADIFPHLRNRDPAFVRWSYDLCQLYHHANKSSMTWSKRLQGPLTKFADSLRSTVTPSWRSVATVYTNYFRMVFELNADINRKLMEPFRLLMSTNVSSSSSYPTINATQLADVEKIFQDAMYLMDAVYGRKTEWLVFKHFVRVGQIIMNMTEGGIDTILRSGRPEAVLTKSAKLQALPAMFLAAAPDLVSRLTPDVLAKVPADILTGIRTGAFCSRFRLADALPETLRTAPVVAFSNALCTAMPDAMEERNRYLAMVSHLILRPPHLNETIKFADIISSAHRLSIKSKAVVNKTVEMLSHFSRLVEPSTNRKLGALLARWNSTINDKDLLINVIQIMTSSLKKAYGVNTSKADDVVKNFAAIMLNYIGSNLTSNATAKSGTFGALIELFNHHPYILRKILDASVNLLHRPEKAQNLSMYMAYACSRPEAFEALFSLSSTSKDGKKVKNLICSLLNASSDAFRKDLLGLIPGASKMIRTLISNITSALKPSSISKLPTSVAKLIPVWEQFLQYLLAVKPDSNILKINRTILMAALSPSLDKLKKLHSGGSMMSVIERYQSLLMPIIRLVVGDGTGASVVNRMEAITKIVTRTALGGSRLLLKELNETRDGWKLLRLVNELEPFLKALNLTVSVAPKRISSLAMKLQLSNKSVSLFLCSEFNVTEVLLPTSDFSAYKAKMFWLTLCSLDYRHAIPKTIYDLLTTIFDGKDFLPRLTKTEILAILQNATVFFQNQIEKVLRPNPAITSTMLQLKRIWDRESATAAEKRNISSIIKAIGVYFSLMEDTLAGSHLKKELNLISRAVKLSADYFKGLEVGNIGLVLLNQTKWELFSNITGINILNLAKARVNVTALRNFLQIDLEVYLCKFGFSALFLDRKSIFIAKVDTSLCWKTSHVDRQVIRGLFNLANFTSTVTQKILNGSFTYLGLVRDLTNLRTLIGLNSTLHGKIFDEVIALAQHLATLNGSDVIRVMLSSPKWWTSYTRLVIERLNSSIPLKKNDLVIMLSIYHTALKWNTSGSEMINVTSLLPNKRHFNQFVESLKSRTLFMEIQLLSAQPFQYLSLLKDRRPDRTLCDASKFRALFGGSYVNETTRIHLCSAAIKDKLFVLSLLNHYSFVNFNATYGPEMLKNVLSWTVKSVNFIVSQIGSSDPKSFNKTQLPELLQSFIKLIEDDSPSETDLNVMLNSTCSIVESALATSTPVSPFLTFIQGYGDMAREVSRLIKEMPTMLCSLSQKNMTLFASTLNKTLNLEKLREIFKNGFRKRFSCSSTASNLRTVISKLLEGGKFIERNERTVTTCLKKLPQLLLNLTNKGMAMREELLKLAEYRIKIPKEIDSILDMLPRNLDFKGRVIVNLKVFLSNKSMIADLAAYSSIPYSTAERTRIKIDVGALAKLSKDQIRRLLCTPSVLRKVIHFPHHSNVSLTKLSSMICYSKPETIDSIARVIRMGSLSLTTLSIKEVPMEPLLQFFSAIVDLLSEMRSLGYLKSLFDDFRFHNASAVIEKVETLLFKIPVDKILAKAQIVRRRVSALASFSIYNKYQTTTELIIRSVTAMKRVRKYLPLRFNLGDFFQNKTQIYDFFRKFKVNKVAVDQLLDTNATVGELEKLSKHESIPEILCKRYPIRRADGLLGLTPPSLKMCFTLTNSDMKKCVDFLFKHASIATYIKTKVFKGVDKTLKVEGSSIKEVEDTISGFSMMEDFIQSINGELTNDNASGVVKKFEGAEKNSTTAAISMAMCGSPSAVTFDIKSLPGASTLTSGKRRRKRSITPSTARSRNFCYDLMMNANKTNAGRMLGRFLQPLMYGKIAVTPDLPWVRRIMIKANETFKETADLKSMVTSMLQTLESFSSVDGKKILSDLRTVMQNPIMASMMTAATGASNVKGTLDKLESLAAGKRVKQLKFYLEMMSNFTSCMATNRIRFYPNEDDDDYIKAISHHGGGKIYAAINFLNINQNNTEVPPKHIHYQIRMSRSLVHQTNFLYYGIFPKYRSNFLLDLKYSQGFVQLQESIDKAIIAEQSGKTVSSLPSVKTRQFPQPCRKVDNFMSTIGKHLVPVMILLSWLTTLLMSVNDALIEKENNMEQALYVMGRSDAKRWVAWSIRHMTTSILMTLLMTFSFKFGGLLGNVDGLIIFLALLSFSFTVLMFGYFISSMFSRTSMALLVAIFTYLVSYVPFAVLSGVSIKSVSSYYKLSMILPITPMAYISVYWGSYQTSSQPFTWADMSDEYLNVTPAACFLVFFVDGFIYLLLGWYIRNVFAGSRGISRCFYFFLTKRYWGIDEDAKSLYTLAARYNDGRNPFGENIYDKVGSKRGSTVSSESVGNDAPIAVSISNLTKKFKSASKPSVSNVSLNLRQNEVTVLLGPNGAGKSTTISMLLGLLKPTSGTITIGGLDREKNYHALRRKIGFCPQHDIFYPDLSTRSNLNYFASIKGISSKEEKNKAVDDILKRLDLRSVAKVPAKKLSGGQKRRLSIGIAFIGKSDLVILDEPTSGVDPTARRAIWNLIATYKERCTVMLCTHHIDEAEIVGDRVAILRDSRLIAFETPQALRRKFGCHYEVALSFADGMKDDCCDDVVQSIVKATPEAAIKPASNDELEISVGSNTPAVQQLGSLFEELEMFSAKGILKSISVSYEALESSFLRILRSSKDLMGGDDETRTDNNKLPQIVEEDMKKGDAIQKSSKIEKEDELLAEKEVTYTSQPENANSLSNRIRVLLYKYALHTLRNWLTYVVQIFLPCLFLAFTLAGTKMLPNLLNSPPFLLTPTQFGPDALSFVKIPSTNGSQPFLQSLLRSPGLGTACRVKPGTMRYELDCSSEFAVVADPKLSAAEAKEYKTAPSCVCDAKKGKMHCPTKYSSGPPPKIVKLPSTDRLMIMQSNITDVPDFLKVESSNKFSTHQNIIWGGWEFAKVNKSITVWYNTQGFHTLPTYFSALSNILLQKYMLDAKGDVNESSEYGISTFTHPLAENNTAYGHQDINKKMTIVSFSLGILVAVSMIIISVALRTLRENLSREKFLQQLYGVSPLLYWTVNFCCDLVSSFVCAGIMSAIFAVIPVSEFSSGLNLPATILLIILYTFSCVPLCYLLCRTANSVGKGFLISFLFLISTGVLFPMLIILLQLFFEGMSLGCLENFAKLIPSAAFTMGLTELAKNQLIADVTSSMGIDTYKNPFGSDMLLSHYLYLFFGGIVFFILNYLLEIQALKKLFHRIHLRYLLQCRKTKSTMYETSTTVPDEEDSGVINERKRVTSAGSNNDPLIVKSLSKNYFLGKKKIAAVTNVNFGIPKGECFGLLGANGAGKTSIFKCVTGELPASRGAVQIMGQRVGMDVHSLDGHVGYCPQTDPLDPYLTVKETISMYARLRGVPEPNRSQQTKQLQEALGIDKHSDVKVKHLSGGTRRKLSLAVALVGQPNLLLLDEPSSGVDVASKRQIWRVLSAVRPHSAILLTSHSMEEMQKISTRLAVMVNGKLRVIGTCAELKANHGLSYSLQIWMRNSQTHDITKLILSRFAGSKLQTRKGNLSEITIPLATTTLSRIFDFVGRLKEDDEIDEFAVQHTTLEHVFLELTASQSEDIVENYDDTQDDDSDVYDTISFNSVSISSIKIESNC